MDCEYDKLSYILGLIKGDIKVFVKLKRVERVKIRTSLLEALDVQQKIYYEIFHE